MQHQHGHAEQQQHPAPTPAPPKPEAVWALSLPPLASFRRAAVALSPLPRRIGTDFDFHCFVFMCFTN